jgi:peptidoglycan/xylan/chitin deacetylase (PgdA/CDA1 family)
MSATVCLSVDFDAVSIWHMFGSRGARALSRGDFGARVGAPRLLELCRRYELQSTWFVPGHTVDNYADVVAEVVAAGHELANHGYLHEDFGSLSREAARDAIRRGSDAIERVAGTRPRGARLTGGDFEPALLEVLVDEGFTYDSSLFGEYFPYWASAERLDEDGTLVRGAPLDLVEVPTTFMTSDLSHFEISYEPPLPAAMPNPRDLESVWRDQFDYMADRLDGAFFMVMCHPQSIGWGSRITMLERFVEHCLDRGARFATVEQVAAEFRAADAAAMSAAATPRGQTP